MIKTKLVKSIQFSYTFCD